jgi:CheY-like chemotaxis protein
MDKPVALIVEDDRDILALFRHVLDIAGYHTEILLNGKEAMERIEASNPSIVLLDLQLPGMSGMDILVRMRSDDRLRNIPVVVITAYPFSSSNFPIEPDLLLQKPVDINQLSNLVQRLQATQGGLNEPTHDDITGLFTFSFFAVRLTFSLERIKQSEFRRFGVLFADIAQVNELKQKLHTEELSSFFRGLADHFKIALRPTDTMAWSPRDESFLTLIEEIPNPEVPLKIAERVRDSMKKFLEDNDYGLSLKVNLGVLLCDSEYVDNQQIMKDIDIARGYLREGLYTNPSIFDREMLKKKQP